MKIKDNLTEAERKALDDLKKNEDITIVNADKGNAVVVFDKSEYVRKDKIPFTGDDYREVKGKTRAQVISQRKKAMATMRREIGIDGRKKEYRYLINSGCSLAEGYGQPKVHKEGMPMRGVVSQTKDPGYKIDKAIAKMLDKYDVRAKSYVQNGEQICRELAKVKSKGEGSVRACLVKLDVEKMYPMTPRKKAMELAVEMMERDKNFMKAEENPHKWKPQQVRRIMNETMKTFFTLIDGTIIEQVDGCPIGKAISGPLVLRRTPARADTNESSNEDWRTRGKHMPIYQ